MPRPTTPRPFPPLVTASTWATALDSLWERQKSARGLDNTPDGAPHLTNAEAVALIRAWRGAVWNMAGASTFPLWYQFAAVAYGWNPPDADTFDVNGGDNPYPAEINTLLWAALRDVADAMDSTDSPPRLEFDNTRFDDVDTVAGVRQQLQQDGAQAAFKIPLPACRDKKTGKLRFPRPNDKPGDCEVATVDDPITYIGKNFGAVLLIVGAIWLLAKKDKPRRQRRTK